jgi:uncharacterized protein YjbI with pentapeptide repeats/uncharacterized membrane protein YqaE (UPF0057 family)
VTGARIDGVTREGADQNGPPVSADDRRVEIAPLDQVLQSHAVWVASSGTEGTRGDLSRRILRGESFAKPDLSGVTFVDADLSGADFSGCRLVLCDFSGALLGRALFDSADASGASFAGADLRAARFREAVLAAVPIKAAGGGFTGRLKAAIFSGALLAGIDLAGADTSACRDLGGRRPMFLDLIRIVFAIFLPPLGVFLQVGLGLHFWLNIVLTLLGYIPGIVHAIWVIVRK